MADGAASKTIGLVVDEPRFGIDGRCLTGGPPSGVNYVRRVVHELAAGARAGQFVVRAYPVASGDHKMSWSGVRCP